VLAAIVGYIVPPVYEARTVLVRADTGGRSGAIGSALNQLGGIAALAGIEGSRDATVVEAIALLNSREFTQSFIRDRNLLPRLFHKRWDVGAGKWRVGVRQPNMWDGYKLFDREIRQVDEDKKTGVVTLRIRWEDPNEAAEWANDLVRRLNAQMKARALSEASTTLEYLTREVRNTNVTSVQVAIENLIEATLKQQAVANVRSEYVFRVVDPAAPPDLRDKVRPHRVIYLVTGAFFGLLLGILVIIGHDALRTARNWLRLAEHPE
jgi:uncharacterized protein involved in exopolysaccharide biosynthesis